MLQQRCQLEQRARESPTAVKPIFVSFPPKGEPPPPNSRVFRTFLRVPYHCCETAGYLAIQQQQPKLISSSQLLVSRFHWIHRPTSQAQRSKLITTRKVLPTISFFDRTQCCDEDRCGGHAMVFQHCSTALTVNRIFRFRKVFCVHFHERNGFHRE